VLAAVKDLGQLVIEKEGRRLLDVLVKDPNGGGNYQHVVTIKLREVNGAGFVFCGVEREEFDSAKVQRYLYRKGPARGADYSPTAKISGKPEGTFERKILGWFRVLDDKEISFTDQERQFLQSIRNELDKNGAEIRRAILNYRDEIPKREGIILTVKLCVGGTWQYVGDFQLFRRVLQDLVERKDRSIYASDKVCSLCGKLNNTVLGGVNTYTFYTLDKPGFITGYFDKKRAWRNFPTCFQCKMALEEGKKYIESNLAFKFYGISYYLIPKSLLGQHAPQEEILDILVDSKKIISLKQKEIDRITDDEEDILAVLKDASDMVALSLLFLKKQNAAERILLLIEDVLPSRLRRIFAAKAAVDEATGANFTFRCFRTFFGKSDSDKRDFDLNGYFLDLTDRVFKDRPVNYHFLLRFLMKKIREEFVADRYFAFAVNDGLMSVLFLEDLKLIDLEVEDVEESALEGLFAKYGPVFQSPLKRGLFLLGVLTELLLRKQYSSRGSRPFVKTLKGLKMGEKDFKGLLPRVQNKLEEYDSFDKGKRLLAREAAAYLLRAGEGWKMSVDEMNFCFAAGMNLADEVAEKIYGKQEVS